MNVCEGILHLIFAIIIPVRDKYVSSNKVKKTWKTLELTCVVKLRTTKKKTKKQTNKQKKNTPNHWFLIEPKPKQTSF